MKSWLSFFSKKFMDNQKVIIESLALDLKRVAIGLHRGSNTMANRFRIEALKREAELENQKPDGYLKKLLEKSRKALENDNGQAAEDALMYSTLFQNFVLKHL